MLPRKSFLNKNTSRTQAPLVLAGSTNASGAGASSASGANRSYGRTGRSGYGSTQGTGDGCSNTGIADGPSARDERLAA